MGLLDGVMGALGGQNGALGGLESLLGNGGLEDMVSKFQSGGLGDVVQSWVSTGANLPISAEQIQSVLGSEQVSSMASSLGIDASQIANVLPGLIDTLTPGGALPQAGGLGDIIGKVASSGMLNNILGGLMKG